MSFASVTRALCSFAMAAAAILCPARAATAEQPYQADSTRRMIELLRQIDDDIDFRRTPLLINDRRVFFSRNMLSQTMDPRALIFGGEELARELLRDGKSEAAIQQFEEVLELIKKHPNVTGATALIPAIRDDIALSYLRLGEQENCICLHSTDSCLMPISGSGIHTQRRGSEKAVELYSAMLKEKPDNMGARWLLNIAYQTLGQWPDEVPPQWLIPPSAFESKYDIKRFVDVAPPLGLATHGLAGGTIVEDFDNDGFLDVMASNWALKGQLRYFHNDGDSTFSERTAEAGLDGLTGGLNLIQADYNNDGFTDVLVLRGAWLLTNGRQPSSLLRNNGNGTFDDVTESAGVMSVHPTQTGAFGDFDNDGWLDLYLGNESGYPIGLGGGWIPEVPGQAKDELVNPCELFHNNRDGTFTRCGEASGVNHIAYVKSVVWGDYNNDGRPDLYISCLGSPNLLYRNDGPRQPVNGSPGQFAWNFTNVAAEAKVEEPIFSFPTWFFDCDNDGWLDLFVAGYKIGGPGNAAAEYLGLPFPSPTPCLYHNNRDGTFTDVAKTSGLNVATAPMGANFGDLDNDGWLDMYLGTGDPDYRTLIPNRAFRNDGGRGFQDVTTSGGLGHLQKGHGVSFADIDNDGDQDIYHVLGGAYTGDVAYSALFLNPGHGNHWLTLKVQGVQSNRSAIGARIKVVVQTSAGDREIHRVVGSGGSFGASCLRAEIGLGDAKAIRSAEIFWPTTGKRQTLTGLQLDHTYSVVEGGEVKPVELRVLNLREAAEDNTD